MHESQPITHRGLDRRAFLALIPVVVVGTAISLKDSNSQDPLHEKNKIPTQPTLEATLLPVEHTIEALDNIPFTINNWGVAIGIPHLRGYLRNHPKTDKVEISLHHYVGSEKNKVQITSDKEKNDVFDLTPRVKIGATETLTGLVEDVDTDEGWYFNLKSFPTGATELEVIHHNIDGSKLTQSQSIPTESTYNLPASVSDPESFEVHSEVELPPVILQEVYNLGMSLNGLGISLKRILLPSNSDLFFTPTSDSQEHILNTSRNNFDITSPHPVSQKGLVILTALGIDLLTDPDTNSQNYHKIDQPLEKLLQTHRDIQIKYKNTEHLTIPDAQEFDIPHLTYPAGDMYMARVLMRQVIPLLKYQPRRIIHSLNNLTLDGYAQSVDMLKASLDVIASSTDEDGFQKFFPDPITQELFQLLGYNISASAFKA